MSVVTQQDKFQRTNWSEVFNPDGSFIPRIVTLATAGTQKKDAIKGIARTQFFSASTAIADNKADIDHAKESIKGFSPTVKPFSFNR